MTETDRRILQAKLTNMEAALKEAYKAITRAEGWIGSMKKMLERIENVE